MQAQQTAYRTTMVVPAQTSETSTVTETNTTINNMYNITNDIGFIHYSISALQNCPYEIRSSTPLHPFIVAMLALINQQKASLVFNQYNYADVLPVAASDSNNAILAQPFPALTGPFNAPVRRVLHELKEWEKIKAKKTIIKRRLQSAQLRQLATLIRRPPLLRTDLRPLLSSKYVQNIANLFRQRAKKPELLYSNKSVYLRYLRT